MEVKNETGRAWRVTLYIRVLHKAVMPWGKAQV